MNDVIYSRPLPFLLVCVEVFSSGIDSNSNDESLNGSSRPGKLNSSISSDFVSDEEIGVVED